MRSHGCSRLSSRVGLATPVDVEFQTNLEESWAGPASRILLTRHAHAGDRFRWTGDDTQRPLSSQGYLEAERITDQLASFAIDRALTSMALRCTETIAPTLASRNMTYEIRDDLWEETPYEEVANPGPHRPRRYHPALHARSDRPPAHFTP